MASTSLKNLPGIYCRETSANNQNSEYLVCKDKKIPKKSVFPDLGINVGNMAGAYTHGVLSNNTADLESYLFGIGTSNLVKTFQKPTQKLNRLDNLKFFEKPGYNMPKPMVIENRQRPIGPFS
tara:strand:- start:105 stop:473 length:369 start_codon:yes stop_codon:yes gene_type:complete